MMPLTLDQRAQYFIAGVVLALCMLGICWGYFYLSRDAIASDWWNAPLALTALAFGILFLLAAIGCIGVSLSGPLDEERS